MEEKETLKAFADIYGQEGKVIGRADFTEIERGAQKYVRVLVNIKGDPSVFPQGNHGVHIHEKGICEPPFLTAGGHFDPGPSGNTDPDVNHPYHMGDLPNIEIKENGTGYLDAISTRITLSEGPLSILGGEGTSIMIHAHYDPYMSGPHKSGVSGGPRVGCGVIKIS